MKHSNKLFVILTLVFSYFFLVSCYDSNSDYFTGRNRQNKNNKRSTEERKGIIAEEKDLTVPLNDNKERLACSVYRHKWSFNELITQTVTKKTKTKCLEKNVELQDLHQLILINYSKDSNNVYPLPIGTRISYPPRGFSPDQVEIIWSTSTKVTINHLITEVETMITSLKAKIINLP